MTFEDWLGKTEGYSSKHERFLDDCEAGIDLTKWLKAAWKSRVPEGYSVVKIPPFKDPSTNNGDWRKDAEYRMGWNACRNAMEESNDVQFERK